VYVWHAAAALLFLQLLGYFFNASCTIMTRTNFFAFFCGKVYVIIGLFLLASTTAVYQCLEPLVRRGKIGAQKYGILWKNEMQIYLNN
jgi:hypothetical protein